MKDDKKEKKYLCDNAELMSVWDWEENNELGLDTHVLTCGSGQKAFWLCNKGHSFYMEIYKKKAGIGCLICSNHQVLSGYNDLATKDPDLAKEWHTIKNGKLTSQQVSSGSSKKVWWQCSMGHEWEAQIKSRSGNKRGCPVCSNYQVLAGYNDLATTNPDLVKEWHLIKNAGLTPQQVISGTLKKVWWQCANGYEWQADINSRNRGAGCPICSGLKVWAGYNDLETTNPALAKEWHPTKNGKSNPQQVMAGSLKKVWWQCSQDHEWLATLNGRNRGSGCPICSNQQLLVGYNDLATANPELVSEWHSTKNKGLSPNQFTPGNNKKVWWKCAKSHEWQASIYHRNHGSGCPKCCAELTTSFPEKAIYFYVKQIYSDAIDNYKSGWLKSFEIDIFIPSLKLGIEYDGERWHKDTDKDLRKNYICFKKEITLIRIRETKCPLLNSTSIDYIMKDSHKDLHNAIIFILSILNKRGNIYSAYDINIERDIASINELVEHSQKLNSLATTNADLAQEWHPIKNGTLSPYHVTSGTQRKVWWICKKGHEWKTSVAGRAYGNGCPICSNKKILAGYNDLSTTNPVLTKEWHPTKNGTLTPQQVTAGNYRKAWWVCSKGHEWQATIESRGRNGSGCPFCSGLYTIEGENDLATVNPELAMQWHPTKNGKLIPQQVKGSSHKKVWWKCLACGNEWEAIVANRDKGRGCSRCDQKKKKNFDNKL